MSFHTSAEAVLRVCGGLCVHVLQSMAKFVVVLAGGMMLFVTDACLPRNNKCHGDRTTVTKLAVNCKANEASTSATRCDSPTSVETDRPLVGRSELSRDSCALVTTELYETADP